jgi:hypothetical protein
MRARPISFYIYFGESMSMDTGFDLDELRLGAGALLLPKATGKPKSRGGIYQTRKGEMFLMGPIPWPWLSRAAAAPGKALHVAVALWFYAGLKKSRTVALNMSRMATMGVTRDSARRGLRRLEKEKLVSVKRHPGRKPIVTILLKRAGKKQKKRDSKKSNGNGNDRDVEGAP